MELEMAEGREKLVEEGEEDKKVTVNGAPTHNGRLLPHDRDSGKIYACLILLLYYSLII